MNTVIKTGLVALAALTAGLSIIHPYGPLKTQMATAPLFAGADMDAAVMKIFERSCQNCHSERTQWPWYSYLAPLSWLIEADVHDGRSHMNLSRWPFYSSGRQIELLTQLGAEVRNRRMPLSRYLKLHPDARLSDEDVRHIYEWAHRERNRLKVASQANSTVPVP